MAASYFSPGTAPKTQILTRIGASSSYVAGLLYSYEDGDIHDALVAAQVRTGLVYLIFDHRIPFLEKTRLNELQDAGAVILIDRFERSIRSQYLLIDDIYAVSGSFLYRIPFPTKYASALDVITDSGQFSDYYNDWQIHYDNSDLYVDPCPPD